MAKRKMSENSLKNLELAKPENNFNNSEVARKAQEKSVEARKRNKSFAEACRIVLDKCQEIALKDLAQDYLLNPEISAETKLKIIQMLADYSGQKPKQEIDTTIKSYSLFEDEVEKKANELIQRTKEADKK